MKYYHFVTLFILMGLLLSSEQTTRLSAAEVAAVVSAPGDPVDVGPPVAPRSANPADPSFSTADAENVEFVGHIGGGAYAVAVQGDYAYIGEGPSLTILDVSNPTSPTVVGKTPPLPGVVQDTAVVGGYAYVVDGSGGLRVVDVSAPSSPTEVGFYNTPGLAYGVAVAGGYAYVADGSGGLRVVDVSTPSNPRETGFYDTLGLAYGVAVVGSYAYVADGGRGSGLRVVDVSTPSAPKEVGFYDMPGDANDVAVAGGYAYVAASPDGQVGGGLRVVDVSDPTAPIEIGAYDIPVCTWDVGVAGIYAYIIYYDQLSYPGDLSVINVSNPANPARVGNYGMLDPRGVAVADGYTYVVDGYYGGLYVIDVSDPGDPSEVGTYNAPGQACGIVAADDYIYIVNCGYGWRTQGILWVVEISAPTMPSVVSTLHTWDALDVTVADGYAYIADRLGLRVVNVSDPADPTDVSFYSTPYDVMSVEVTGDYAYVVTASDGLRVVDVSDPTALVEVGLYAPPWNVYGVAVAGDYAYVDARSAGLRVVDISDPTAPVEVGFYEYSGEAVVVDDYAYVAAREAGLRIVDISHPTMPSEVGLYDTPESAWDIAVAGDYAYVATESAVWIVDVSTPSNPIEVGFYDTSGGTEGVAADEGYAYVADGADGLLILRFMRSVYEARADIGMPYNIYRGCSSPYVGCGGPYHGFYYGVCTDLALDAYTAGVPFNIQSALNQDRQAHPGRYRYGTARHPEDMRRYFYHNQQWLSHGQPYQRGDVAFFDWDADGLSDHMGVVSDVDGNGRPLRMVHATGVCQVNPGGRAFEQGWNSRYDQYIQGHGRLHEAGALLASADGDLQLLRITVDSPALALRLRDANGKSTSDTYDENLVAGGVEAAIPYIPGGRYTNRGAEQVISVTWPLSNTSQYFVELAGQSPVTYHLRVETLQGAAVTSAQVFTQAIAASETRGSTITLGTPGVTLLFPLSPPAAIPVPDIPSTLTLSGLVGTSAQGSFTITETGGQRPLQNATLSITSLMDSLGGTAPGSLLVVSPGSFTVPMGGSQDVDVEVSLAGVAPGVYRGALVLHSDNGGTWMIPLTLAVQFHQVYLPATLKSY